MTTRLRVWVLGCMVLLLMALATPAGAAEKLRVGKSVPFAWTFTPLDVGIETGAFARHGLEIERSSFAGDARLQQGLTADSIDVGIGSGPGMAFMAKGVPAKAVAAMAGLPANIAVVVNYELADQDGRRSQRQENRRDHGRLAHRLARQADRHAQGLGPRRGDHRSGRWPGILARRDEDRADRRPGRCL